MIPNTIHFCFGFAQPPTPFMFVHYLAVKSAWWVNRPSEIVLHYAHAPGGQWWDRVQRYARLEQIEPPTQVFGRPLRHFAHQSDVFRLECLLRQGGIYLDVDVLCLRPFTGLLGRECVMGRQLGLGLCNAVMLAAPASRFLAAWHQQYRTFRSAGRDKRWDEHSVRLPRKLAAKRGLRDTITVLPETAFFFPLWGEIDRFLVAGDVTPFDGSYCVHLWETFTVDRLRAIAPDSVRLGESALAKLMRPVMADETG
jgi:hypothetical protein